jgi:AcrR family transcriptional regulator
VRAPGRTLPQQARSRKTFERLLEAAGQIVDEVGVAGATMESFAQRAGLSIGSVYRFFPDKQAVVDAINERWQAHLVATFTDLYSPQSLERDADAVIAEFVQLLPGALEGMPGGRGLISADLVRPLAAADERWTEQVETFIRRYAPHLAPARRRTAAGTYLTITYALIVAAVRSEAAMSEQLQEARAVLTGYIRELTREGERGHQRS